ncbi:hypothetical protein Hte_007801 [Hypoxylon texense]
MASDRPRSSFGVELEFVVLVRFRDVPLPLHLAQFAASRPQGCTTIDCNRRDDDEMVAQRVIDLLTATVAEALKGSRGDRVATSGDQLGETENRHLAQYTEWRVKRDTSVQVEGNIFSDDLFWHDVEVVSPALWATEPSFDEVRAVVNALNRRWWILAPRAAGLHIHYGRGNGYIPFEQLRKIGAFLYAADPILAQMHPEHRRGTSEHYPSNRLYSNLAHGATPELAMEMYLENVQSTPVDMELPGVGLDDCIREEAGLREERERREQEEGEQEKGKAEEGGAEDEEMGDEEAKERAPTFPTVFKRGALPGYEFNPEFFERPWEQGQGRTEPVDILTGVLQVLASDRAPVVSKLQSHLEWRRSAYNFEQYGTYYRAPRDPVKRTIEFRQAAGSTDADEVLAHIKIAVGLADFASTLSYGELWKWALDLSDAEEDPKWYDVFDILFELGLVDEARVIQRCLARDRDIVILDEATGAYQMPPPDRPRRPFDEIKDLFSSIWN